MLALSIFTCSRPHTIVDEPELNFCVRDGNRWTLRPINTNLFAGSNDLLDCILKTEHRSVAITFSKGHLSLHFIGQALGILVSVS